MVARRGHSLVELMVALTLLAGSLASISATTHLSLRRTQDAVQLQEAGALALAVMDSLLADPDPRAGSGTGDWGTMRWEAEATEGGRVLRVRVGSLRDDRTVAEVESFWVPVPPIVPGTAP